MDLTETVTFRGDQVRWGAVGEGDPLVLLHGTPFCSAVWRRIAPHLARRRRVYAFDLLGYGASDKHAGQDVSLGVQNELFAALLDHWGLDRPDVVAHDFGGATALRTHLLDGRDYRTLTLIDPVALNPWGSQLVGAARGRTDAYAALPPYVHEAVVRAYLAAGVHRTLDETELRRYLDPWLGEVGQAAFYRQIAQMDDRWTDVIQDRLGDLRCPVTILWGAQDAWIPVAGARAGRAHPGCRAARRRRRRAPAAGGQPGVGGRDGAGGARRRPRLTVPTDGSVVIARESSPCPPAVVPSSTRATCWWARRSARFP